MTPAARRIFAYAFLALALGAVLSLTLLPDSGPDTGVFRLCLLCGDFGLADFILNVILFVPLGLALRWVRVPARWAIPSLAALSLGIELAQLGIPGRESTLGDVISNSTGAALGVFLWWWLPRRHRALRDLLVAAAIGLAVLAATRWALQPEFPPTVYYGQWTPDLGSFEVYGGKVLSADIAGLPLHSWRLDDTDPVRRRLEAGDPLRVRFVAGPQPSRLAPIFSMADQHTRGILLLGADRRDLVFRVSTRAVDARLNSPELRWRDAFAGVSPGDTLSMALWRTPDGWCLTLGQRRRCGLRLGVAAGWKLLLGWRFPAAVETVFDAAWLIVLLAPTVAAALVLLARHIPSRKSSLRSELP